jgi:hypothetical protein
MEMPPVLRAAEQGLSEHFGSLIRLSEPQPLSGSNRSRVSRCRLLEGPSAAPGTVIIKRAGGAENDEDEYNPEDSPPMIPAWRLFNDWAGAQFLSSLPGETPLAPRFYCGSRALGFIVIEDLGDGESLSDILLARDAIRAEAGLLAMAATLGRMHAVSAGRFEEFAALRTALGPANLTDRSYLATDLREYLEQVRNACGAIDFPLPPALNQEVEAIATTIEQPGGFLVYTHGDPCPGNDCCSAGALRLFDFEFGLFRHALLDGVYWRVPFPTCWAVNRVPPRLVHRLDELYREELAKGCAAAHDDEPYHRAVVEACAYWTLRTTGWHLPGALKEDEQWGIASRRQRVLARLRAFAETSAEFNNHLPAIAGTCRQLAQRLQTLWPEVEEMPLFPAFR